MVVVQSREKQDLGYPSITQNQYMHAENKTITNQRNNISSSQSHNVSFNMEQQQIFHLAAS